MLKHLPSLRRLEQPLIPEGLGLHQTRRFVRYVDPIGYGERNQLFNPAGPRGGSQIAGKRSPIVADHAYGIQLQGIDKLNKVARQGSCLVTLNIASVQEPSLSKPPQKGREAVKSGVA